MAKGFLKRSMSYLGLTDDRYDEIGVPLPDEEPDPITQELVAVQDVSPTRSEPTVQLVGRERSSTVSLIAPHAMRTRSTELSPHVHTVAPAEFGDAREIADSVMTGQPVIVNLQGATRELKRRMIDFCSGVTYALGGSMERIASNVFLITPSDVELSAEERRRA